MVRHGFFALIAFASLLLTNCSPKPKAKYTIAVIPKGLTHEFWQSIERGARRAAADLGELGTTVQILWEGPRTESEAREQIGIVQQMKSRRGMSGIVLAPQDSKAMVPVVKECFDSKIPVVIIDSGLEDESLFVKYVATDNYNGGKMAAKRLLEVLAKDGKAAPKLVLFRYAPGSESTEQREKGFIDEVNAAKEKQKQEGKPTVEIISDNVYSGATVDTAQAASGPLLGKVKDQADGIFAVNESAATGMLNAMRSQGLNKKIKLVAFDSSEPLLQAVEDGDVEGLIVQDPYRMGYLGVWVLVKHLEGVDVSKGGKNLSTGEFLLTKENLKETEARQRFDRALQGKRTIEAPALGK
jgi:ribose transport system substrate-binding protein